MQYHHFRAMNTTVVLAAEGKYLEAAFDAAQTYIEENERRFTRFSNKSELSQLNLSAGRIFSASAEMMMVMTAALECHTATQGLFNPAILPDLKAIGYEYSFDQVLAGDIHKYSDRHLWLNVLPFSEVELDAAQNKILLPHGMQIDLGGIAKGWIAEQAARLMSRYVPACAVNAGGDMFLIGQPEGRTDWEIGLEDPLEPTKDLMALLVQDGAVATSSTTKRIWTQDGQPRHHLIDPRSNSPVISPWLSVTVFAPKAVLAETFAKALLIAGPNDAGTLLDGHPEISFLAVDAEKQIWRSPTEKELIHEYA